MQHTITLGSAVRCADGKAGSIGGLIINPNRSHLDYVVIDPGPLGGREYYLPIAQIQRADAGELRLDCSRADLDDLPRAEVWTEQGTVQDNLRDLYVARAGTPVHDAESGLLGRLRGALVDADFQIQAIVLDEAPDAAVPIASVAIFSDATDDLVVHLARQAAAG